MELNLEKIGKNVLVARTILGLTQEGLAKKIGMNQTWIQKVEKGEIDLCITNINKLSHGLNMEPINLLFSSPNQVFNFTNCTQSGNFQNCTINSVELIEKLASYIKSNKNQ